MILNKQECKECICISCKHNKEKCKISDCKWCKHKWSGHILNCKEYVNEMGKRRT